MYRTFFLGGRNFVRSYSISTSRSRDAFSKRLGLGEMWERLGLVPASHFPTVATAIATRLISQIFRGDTLVPGPLTLWAILARNCAVTH